MIEPPPSSTLGRFEVEVDIKSCRDASPSPSRSLRLVPFGEATASARDWLESVRLRSASRSASLSFLGLTSAPSPRSRPPPLALPLVEAPPVESAGLAPSLTAGIGLASLLRLLGTILGLGTRFARSGASDGRRRKSYAAVASAIRRLRSECEYCGQPWMSS